MKSSLINFAFGAVFLFALQFLFFFVVFPSHVLAYSSDDILVAVNSVRNDNGLPLLTKNEQLKVSANLKFADIKKYQYWSHDNPKTGKKWLEFIRESGYRYGAGENLARGFNSVEDVITAWLNSPSHRKNLLSSKFNSVGITSGTINYSDKAQDVVVLEFGATPQKLFSSLFSRLSFSSPVVML